MTSVVQYGHREEWWWEWGSQMQRGQVGGRTFPPCCEQRTFISLFSRLTHPSIQLMGFVHVPSHVSHALIHCDFVWLNFMLAVQSWIIFHLKYHTSYLKSYCFLIPPNPNSSQMLLISPKAEWWSSVPQPQIFYISHFPQYKVPALSLVPDTDSRRASNPISYFQHHHLILQLKTKPVILCRLSCPSLSTWNLSSCSCPQSWWLLLAFTLTCIMERIKHQSRQTCILVWAPN